MNTEVLEYITCKWIIVLGQHSPRTSFFKKPTIFCHHQEHNTCSLYNFKLTCSTHEFVEYFIKVEFLKWAQHLTKLEIGNDGILRIPDDVDYLDLLLPHLRRQELAWKMRLDQPRKTCGKHLYQLVSRKRLVINNLNSKCVYHSFNLNIYIISLIIFVTYS